MWFVAEGAGCAFLRAVYTTYDFPSGSSMSPLGSSFGVCKSIIDILQRILCIWECLFGRLSLCHTRESRLYDSRCRNARNGIVQRMASPIDRNAQWCCDTVGLSLYNIHSIRFCFSLCVWFFTWLGSNVPHWTVFSWTSSNPLESNVFAVTWFAWVGLYCWGCVHWLVTYSFFHVCVLYVRSQ